eukprot:4305133-Lingulodinium_polyedra.AAC.1
MECVGRAIGEPRWRQTVDSTASCCTVSKTVHNVAVELTVRGRNGSRIARLAHSMRTPQMVFA